MRATYIRRDVMAGCYICGGGTPLWTSKNAQGVAAIHHDKTGHATWVDVNMTIRYGKDSADSDAMGDAAHA